MPIFHAAKNLWGSRLSAMLAAALLILTLWHLSRNAEFGFLGGDTEEYSAMSASILRGELFNQVDPSFAHRGLFIRPPGYPAVLAVARILGSTDLKWSLQLIHSGLFLIAALVWSWGLRNTLAPFISVILIGLPAWKLLDFFRSNISEWTSFCTLLVLIALTADLAAEKAAKPLARRCFALGLIASVLTLTKPAFFFTLPLAALITTLFGHRKGAAYAALGFLPVLLWCSINLHRIGSFTIAQQSGFAFVAIAGDIAQAPVFDEDPPQLTRCLAHLNLHRAHNPDSPSDAPAIQKAAFELLQRGDYRWPALNECMATFAWRVIPSHLGAYLRHVALDFLTLGESWAELLLLVISAYLVRAHEQRLRLWGLSGAALTAHLGYLSTVALTQHIASRYLLLTNSLVLLVGITLALAWYIERRNNNVPS